MAILTIGTSTINRTLNLPITVAVPVGASGVNISVIITPTTNGVSQTVFSQSNVQNGLLNITCNVPGTGGFNGLVNASAIVAVSGNVAFTIPTV